MAEELKPSVADCAESIIYAADKLRAMDLSTLPDWVRLDVHKRLIELESAVYGLYEWADADDHEE